jgi:succinate-semialdehyde dehydrogenase/glutarate-semialdehyde dehydrogenase
VPNGDIRDRLIAPSMSRIRDTGDVMSTVQYAVVNPATGETLRRYDASSDEDVRDAVDRAHRAHEDWQSSTLEQRAAMIRRVGDLHDERKQELAEIIMREMGKPIAEAIGEVEFCVSIYGFYADNAEELLADEPIKLLNKEGSAFVRKSSYGVLLGIMPWNYPYYQVARFAGPNLLIGNTILLKHAAQCPESAAAMGRIFHEAGIPTDAYINLYATHQQIEWLIGDPRVRGVSLTGSEAAGARVAEIAGRHLKKVVLELGGSDPFIVLGTQDLDGTVDAAVGARLPNAGQACNAAKRFIVVEELYDEFVDKFKEKLTSVEPGDPSTPGTAMGPLSSAQATDFLEAQVKRAVDEGAQLLAGGERDGNYYKATLLADIAPNSRARYEEFFGPVAQVYRVKDEEEAIRLANDTPYGLGSYVMSPDADQALRVAEKIDAGMVFINGINATGPEMPFGGVKRSGYGRELGRYGVDEFVNKKLIRIVR